MARGGRRAESILRCVLAERFKCQPAVIEIGRFTFIGEGLSRRALAAGATVQNQEEESYVVLLPDSDEIDPERDAMWAREFSVLERLQGLQLPFQTPTPIGVAREKGRPVLVRTMLAGLPLHMMMGIQSTPWDIQAHAAAAVHAIDCQALGDLIPRFPSRQAHALERLKKFEGLSGPEASDALAWALANLPPQDPPSVLHGDLLSQNVLLDPMRGLSASVIDCKIHFSTQAGISDMRGLNAYAVIDWEEALIGDPAYDLAILTRGVRRPFKDPDGFANLLQTYRSHGGRVEDRHVRLHELCLAAGWLHHSLRHRGESCVEPPKEARARLARILEMATGPGARALSSAS